MNPSLDRNSYWTIIKHVPKPFHTLDYLRSETYLQNLIHMNADFGKMLQNQEYKKKDWLFHSESIKDYSNYLNN